MGNREVVERYARAANDHDLDAQDALTHDDYIARWPQSGEVIRGRANRRAIVEHYPGGLQPAFGRVLGHDEEFVAGPSWNIVHITGSGADDEITAVGTVTYPNGEKWHVVTLFVVRDEKIWREVNYYAEPFEAPGWRRPYVEIEGA